MRGRKLDKIGLKWQDTSELFFEDCRVPAQNLLGKEGQGFMMLMQKLQQERLVRRDRRDRERAAMLADTIAYTKERSAFGKPIA